MRIFSFTQDGNRVSPVEVELSLVPGLPQVHFTGLPDIIIKESIMRIKSAIRSQGFEWPKTRQMIINLRPAYLKKSSQGLELAIACALLWKTKQVPPPSEMTEPFYVYGELSLRGEVAVPSDWQGMIPQKTGILTGVTKQDNYLCPLFQISELNELEKPSFVPVKSISELLEKPKIPHILFSKKTSELLAITASGEHSLFLAGEAGSGKSTILEHLIYLLMPPTLSDFSLSRQIRSRSTGEDLKWRPFINPHHSTTPLSMIGGGYPLFMGEITKAHGGILFMDEYLEFHPRVQEALREPLEKGEIRIVRKGSSEVFPAHFLLLAASNLCPCGDLVPGRSTACAYSLRRCLSHMNRLSGPMLDRFEILAFSPDWKGDLTVSLKDIDKQVMKAYQFRKKRGQEKPNSQLSLQELESSLTDFLKDTQQDSHVSSKRRKRSILRVARTIADMEESVLIKAEHIEHSKVFSFTPFIQMKHNGFLT